MLMPGESDTVTFTFYGHADIGSEAKALCDVEGGPCYELDLQGEASIVQYEFDTKYIDYGKRVSCPSHVHVECTFVSKALWYRTFKKLDCSHI